MSLKFVTTVTLTVCLGTAACIPKINTAAETKLIDGEEDKNGSHYPSAFFLRTGVDSVVRCTAVKIAPGTILTAAHCIERPAMGSYVEKGVAYSNAAIVQNKDEVTPLVLTKKAVVHPVYSTWAKQQTQAVPPYTVPDVGFIYVQESGTFASIPQATLDFNPIKEGEALDTLGYGCNVPKGNGSKLNYPFFRRFLADKAITIDKQYSFYGRYLDVSPICTGDSGAPLFRKTNGTAKLVAVGAFLNNKNQSYLTLLSEVKDFIESAGGVANGAQDTAPKILPGDAPTNNITTNTLVPNQNCRYRVAKSPTQAAVYAYKDKAATKKYDAPVPSCKQVCVDDKDIDDSSAKFSKQVIYKRVLLDKNIAYIGHINLHLPEKCQK